MEPIYRQEFYVSDAAVDRYGRLKPSALLTFAQEVAGQHCTLLSLGYDALAKKRMFWAVIRQRVLLTRLPLLGETITVETWPMPTTRVAFPRSTVAYDSRGEELFRSISLWVLMDSGSRGMILPGKSGVIVGGTLRGTELAVPGSLAPKHLENTLKRTVRYSELDRNGHMNNTRYLDWVDDLLTSAFHQAHTLREFTVCYLSEALEGETMNVFWQLTGDGVLQVDAHRETDGGGKERIFTAQAVYE